MFEAHKEKARDFLRRHGEMRGYRVTEQWPTPAAGTVTLSRGGESLFEVRLRFDAVRQRVEIERLANARHRRGRSNVDAFQFNHDNRPGKDVCIRALLSELEFHFRSFTERVSDAVGYARSVDGDDFSYLSEEAEAFFAERATERLLAERNGVHFIVSVFGDRYSGWVTVARVNAVETDDHGDPDLTAASIDLDHVEYLPNISELSGHLEMASEQPVP